MDRFFLNPWALALAGLAGGIVLLYILKLKRAKVKVSSTLLWERSVYDFKANAPWQKLRRNLLMFLQIAALILLALALARPFIFGKALSGGKNVVVIDASASMLSTDEQPDRLGRAIEAAEAMITDLSRNDQGMIIAAGAQPTILSSFTKDKSELLDAVRRVRDSAGGVADIDAALRLVASVTAGSGARVVLFSDGAIPPVDPSSIVDDSGKAAMNLSFFNVGTSGENIAITGAGARFNPFNDDYELFVALRNFYSQAQTVDLTLSVNDDMIDVREVELGAGQRKEVVLSNMPYIPEPIRVEIDLEDPLAADNVAYISMPREDKYKVALCKGGESLLLTKVLGSMDFVELYEYQGTGDESDIDVWVVEGDAPSGINPGASYLFIDSTNHPFLPVTPGVRAELDFGADPPVVPTVVGQDRGHELLRFANMGGLQFTATRRSVPLPWGKVVLDGSEGPLLVEGFSDGQRTLYLGFNIYDSDFPLRAAFPIFMANAIRYLGRASTGGSGFSFPAGERIDLLAPIGTATVDVVSPTGKQQTISTAGREFTLADTTDIGVYQLTYLDDQGQGIENLQLPVSLHNEAESDLAPASSIRVQGSDGELAGGDVGQEIAGSREVRVNREFYTWLILAVLLIMGVEWYLYHTRAF